ncbi:hypothetical protein VB773_02285 [Haloarculaceae archaeon H-GB2-1]|nr:hypothetical protein [Haloarculaceae archaeon H-GB11]MEA5406522.1 hypothetical protein [Haloarculaceae archaeon H-GB2-1]
MADEEVSLRQKLDSLRRVSSYRPVYTAFIIVFSFVSTLFEAVGLTFLVPIIEAAQSSGGQSSEPSAIAGMFLRAYDMLNIPFTLEYMILGVALVMTLRYTLTFAAKWLALKIRIEYEKYLKQMTYELALGATISYYDNKGSDDILNAIITQTRYAGRIIQNGVKLFQQSLLSLIYVAIALSLAPSMTAVAAVLLGE